MTAIRTTIRKVKYPARGELMKVGQVWVIESLGEDDCHTGRWIREHLEDLFLARGLNVKVTFRAVGGRTDLLTCLGDLRDNILRTRLYPILDIECHGLLDFSGLALRDGSTISWEEIKPALQEINRASRFNLFLIMAACNGGYFGQIARLEELSAVCALLGPPSVVDDRVLLEALKAFYTELFSGRDATHAINAARAAVPGFPYFFSTAEGLFRLGAEAYLRDYATPTALRKRAQRLVYQFRFEGRRPIPTVAALTRVLKDQERPYFKRAHRIFFDLDQIPENEERYPIAYDDLVRAVRVGRR